MPQPVPASTAEDLSSAVEDLFSWTRRSTPAGGLSLTAGATLARLRREGSSGVTALAVAEGVSQPGMSQLVARLERDGLVARTASPDDGRASLVALTAEGERVLARRRTERASVIADLLAGAPGDDVAAVAAALPALLRLSRGRPAGAQPAGSTTTTPDL